MASAEFTVNGLSAPPEIDVAASSTVNLALVSTTGVRLVQWSIIGNHAAAASNPTITPAGSPNGATASFVMPVGSGQAYLVQCVINGGVDETGQAVTNYTKRALVGVVDSSGGVPFALGETDERSATHGYIERLNEIATSVAGGDHGALAGLTDDDHGTGANAYDLAFRPMVAYTGAANTTVLADARKHITTSHTATNTLTIPANASVAYVTGTILVGTNVGTGTTTITPDGGVTFTTGQTEVPPGAWWRAKKTGTNTWLVETLELRDPLATSSTGYTFVASDAFREVGFTSGSATTATIPPNSDVAFRLGTRLRFHQYGAGQVTVAQGSGVTIRTPATLKARTQYSSLEAVKIATNEWVLTGDLEV